MLVKTVAPEEKLWLVHNLLRSTYQDELNSKSKEDRLKETDEVSQRSFLLACPASRMFLNLNKYFLPLLLRSLFRHSFLHLVVLVH